MKKCDIKKIEKLFNKFWIDLNNEITFTIQLENENLKMYEENKLKYHISKLLRSIKEL